MFYSQDFNFPTFSIRRGVKKHRPRQGAGFPKRNPAPNHIRRHDMTVASQNASSCPQLSTIRVRFLRTGLYTVSVLFFTTQTDGRKSWVCGSAQAHEHERRDTPSNKCWFSRYWGRALVHSIRFIALLYVPQQAMEHPCNDANDEGAYLPTPMQGPLLSFQCGEIGARR